MSNPRTPRDIVDETARSGKKFLLGVAAVVILLGALYVLSGAFERAGMVPQWYQVRTGDPI